MKTRIDLTLIFEEEQYDEKTHTTLYFKDAMGTKYVWRAYAPINGSYVPRLLTEFDLIRGHICKVRATVKGLDSSGCFILSRVAPRKKK